MKFIMMFFLVANWFAVGAFSDMGNLGFFFWLNLFCGVFNFIGLMKNTKSKYELSEKEAREALDYAQSKHPKKT